jgi:hypothetical protein
MNEELKEQFTLKRDALKRGPRDKWQRAAMKSRASTAGGYRESSIPKGYYRDLANDIREGYDHFWSIRRVANPY